MATVTRTAAGKAWLQRRKQGLTKRQGVGTVTLTPTSPRYGYNKTTTPSKITPKTSPTPPTTALSRFNTSAAAEGNQAAVNLALLEAENTGAAGTTLQLTAAAMQAQSPSMQRLTSPQWAGMTGQMNNAQQAQGGGPVWVTVPVDKVIQAPGGGTGIAPVYATPKGYQARPGESVGSIPPVHTQAVGRP
jgi:cytoskeletal protein RodZ